MTHPIIEYLKKHGELPATKIYIPGMTLGAIKNALRKFYIDGVLLRREIPMDGTKARMCMAYSLSGKTPAARKKPLTNEERIRKTALKTEPNYAYHLRNLPRPQKCESTYS
jgi:hypothetical protein